MPYLIADDLPAEPAGIRFRRLVERGAIAQLPGAHNGMAALQAKRAGFEGLYLSGAAMTASMGIPDLGMITVDEVCFFVRQVARASGLPLLVDGDTGYGEARATWRTKKQTSSTVIMPRSGMPIEAVMAAPER